MHFTVKSAVLLSLLSGAASAPLPSPTVNITAPSPSSNFTRSINFTLPTPTPSSNFTPSANFTLPSPPFPPNFTLPPFPFNLTRSINFSLPSPSANLTLPSRSINFTLAAPSPSANHTHPKRAACNVVSDVARTFYGFPDNDPPGPAISKNCGRGGKAGGVGTYSNPLTFATAPGEFNDCEIIYDPYLRKYLINEDYCATCTRNWANGIWQVDVWTGHSATNGAADQVSCENTLTPASNKAVIRNPKHDLQVDETPLYVPGQNSACNLNHVFADYNAQSHC